MADEHTQSHQRQTVCLNGKLPDQQLDVTEADLPSACGVYSKPVAAVVAVGCFMAMA
jgi:hypothetical protein